MLKHFAVFRKKIRCVITLLIYYFTIFSHYSRRGGKPRGGMRGGRSGMEDGSGGMNRDMTSGGGRGGYSGRGGYHQGGYRGGNHGPGGMLGRGSDVGQGEHMSHGPAAVFKPAPEFEMKGNDFPALPGLDEPRKVSESSDAGGGSKAWEAKG